MCPPTWPNTWNTSPRPRPRASGLLVFPELSLTGYYLQDLVYEVAMHPTADDPTFGALLQASRDDMDLTVGFVEEDARHRFYIAGLSQRGEVVHVHHKVYLPTYGLFDEGRYFAWGDSVQAFETRFGRVGMLICEDFWHASPPYLLWLDGADLLLLHSASPGRGLDGRELRGALGGAGQPVLCQPVHQLRRPLQPDRLRRRAEFLGRQTSIDPNGVVLLRGRTSKRR